MASHGTSSDQEPAQLERLAQAAPARNTALLLALQVLRATTVVDAGVASAPPTDLAPGQLLGGYVIRRLLGAGGMGVVYLAEQIEPFRRLVALKLVEGQALGGLADAYFRVERQAMAQMSHPAIAKVYDSDHHTGLLFVAMEYVDGSPIDAYCTRRALPPTERAALIARVARGVHHAHQKGVLHRDLKPGNILVTEVDGKPEPKIIDFGIALLAEQWQGTPGGDLDHAGTSAFMSPEQSDPAGGGIDTRADVFSLGVVALMLLGPAELGAELQRQQVTARELFDALASSLATPPRQRGDGHDRRREALSRLPRDLRWVLRRSIDPDREQRYPSAEAFAADLDAFAQSRPVAAAPRSALHALRCYALRHRYLVGASSVALLALLLGVTATVLGWAEARRQRDLAIAAKERSMLEASKSQQVSEFLGEILASVDPEVAKGLDRTLLRQILGAAAQRAESRLAAQPEVRAAVQTSLARSYAAIADFTEALRFAQAAYVAAEQSLGPDHVDTLTAGGLISHAQYRLDQRQEALATAKVMHERALRSAGSDSPIALRLGMHLAYAESVASDDADAVGRVEALLPIMDRVFGPLHRETLRARLTYATFLRHPGSRVADAEAALIELQALDARAAPDDRLPATLLANTLGLIYASTNRLELAGKAWGDALARAETAYGPRHALTLTLALNLGELFLATGDLSRAEPYLRRAQDEFPAVVGDTHELSLRAVTKVGVLLQRQGHFDAAIANLERALRGFSEAKGPTHISTGWRHLNLGEALLEQGRLDLAATHLHRALEIVEMYRDAKSAELGPFLRALAKLAKREGNARDAEQYEARLRLVERTP